MPDPAAPFETWLLHRVAGAVENREVPAALLTELHAEIAEARENQSPEREAVAIQELAERMGLSVGQLKQLLASLEAQPRAAREAFLRGFVEAWLVQQREEYGKSERDD